VQRRERRRERANAPSLNRFGHYLRTLPRPGGGLGEGALPRNRVAWPPAVLAASRKVAAGRSLASQRTAPPHSIHCASPRCNGGMVTSPPAATAGACRRRASPGRAGAARKRRRPSALRRRVWPARRAPLTPRRTIAASAGRHATKSRTAARAARPLFIFRRAAASSSSYCSVVSAAGFGSTLSETSVIRPSVPERADHQPRHIVAGDVLDHLAPKRSGWPVPSIRRTPSTKSRAAPA